MAESIFARVGRLLSATVEDSVDRMELAGGDAVMRETIREVDRAIDQVDSEHQSVMARRLQAARQQKMMRDRIEELEAKAKFAVGQGRDDLAEAALSRQVDFEAQIKKLDEVQTLAREAEAKFEDNLAALRTRKGQMEDALNAYASAQQDAALGGDGPTRAGNRVEANVTRAEAAFDRAMTGAGGVGYTRADAETISRVAEIDTMHKGAVIADRLAALKVQPKAA